MSMYIIFYAMIQLRCRPFQHLKHQGTGPHRRDLFCRRWKCGPRMASPAQARTAELNSRVLLRRKWRSWYGGFHTINIYKLYLGLMGIINSHIIFITYIFGFVHTGVGIDVPILGDWFHITKTKICWRWNITNCWVMFNWDIYQPLPESSICRWDFPL